ncbi:hypothetical protein K491DRAFT_251992 [Lophiostoma macrostomum CBS 122681]|uniref:Uncharacterized protein n=1 Tax=Lophiostoma macrostomum CBS 122681 TaxID=1314788 RepID=A0A6A6TFE7_9PLEO|nr:hypothetical protein K491DRAFT_251992 [Lophiostoma macrostomum CBS 122681]
MRLVLEWTERLSPFSRLQPCWPCIQCSALELRPRLMHLIARSAVDSRLCVDTMIWFSPTAVHITVTQMTCSHHNSRTPLHEMTSAATGRTTCCQEKAPTEGLIRQCIVPARLTGATTSFVQRAHSCTKCCQVSDPVANISIWSLAGELVFEGVQ